MYFQVNLGSAQTFNQIEMNSGGSAGDYARGYNVEVSTNGTTFTSVAAGTGTASPETVTFATQTAQYIRVVLTAGVTTNWWSIAEFTVYSSGGGGSGPPTGGSLGSNVYVFTPSDAQSTIQSTLNTISGNQVSNQFGTQRYALLFEPGTYGSAANPLVFTVGFYTSVAGLGQNPERRRHQRRDQLLQPVLGHRATPPTTSGARCSNLTINVIGNTGCYAGDDFWAVSQACAHAPGPGERQPHPDGLLHRARRTTPAAASSPTRCSPAAPSPTAPSSST